MTGCVEGTENKLSDMLGEDNVITLSFVKLVIMPVTLPHTYSAEIQSITKKVSIAFVNH